MVSVIKGQSQLETLYCIMLFIEDKRSSLSVTTTDTAANSIEASGHRWHGEEGRSWEEV